MKLSRYAIADKDADGNLYVVVTLDDGSTFGQWMLPGTAAEVDAQVQASIDRQAPKPVIGTPAPVGTVRTSADVLAAAPKPLVVP